MSIVNGNGSGNVRARRASQNVRRARFSTEILERRELLATIIVNSAGDADGADGGTTLSLRQAIEVSNGTLAISSLTPTQAGLVTGALSTPNTIDFAIPGTGPFTIMPGTALPTITTPVVIDGYSQPGAHPNTNGPGQGKNTVIQIEIDGANAPGSDGLDLKASNSTVQGLAIGGFVESQTGSNGGYGISIESQTGELIQGDFIGTDASGTRSLPNTLGIRDSNPGTSAQSTYNTIGGTAAGAGNVISGNTTDGLSISGSLLNISGTHLLYYAVDTVEGNFIGSDVTGLKALPNGKDGIDELGDDSTIGGTAAGAGNVISGNAGDGMWAGGIFISLNGNTYVKAPDDLVEGNRIGTDVTGLTALPNGGDGMDENEGGSTIGGTAAGAGNVIAYNQGAGVNNTGGAIISGNSIFANAGTGIVPSSSAQAPVLQSVTQEGSGSLITGTISGMEAEYIIEFFSNITPDPSGSGQGQTYLGSTSIMAPDGPASFAFSTPMALLGLSISATATDQFGVTSGFARNLLGYTLPTTTVSLAGPSQAVTQGQPITLSATVASSSGGVPTGAVAFSADGVMLGDAALDASGVAVFTAVGLGPGAHAFQAAYLGDAANAPSSSNAVAVAVVPPTTTITLLGPNRVATQGVPITFAVAVASNTGAVPTGQVAFLEDGVVLGSSPLEAQGLASFVTDQLLPGPHVITAEYLGGPTNPAGLSNAVAVQVFNATAFGGPAVTSDVFSGPNAVTVTFNRGLFIGPAQDVTNYKIVGPRHQTITILSAVYNPSNASVTLTTAQALDPHKTYQLTINGQKGDRVVDVFGIALNGKTKGKPGHNYSGKIKVKKAPVVKVTHASSPKVKVKVHVTAHKKER
jgi:hypothetical protein